MRKGRRLSEVLRRAVKDSGMSVNSIALASGVPQPSLHLFVTGQGGLHLGSVEKLMGHFGLEVRGRGKTRPPK